MSGAPDTAPGRFNLSALAVRERSVTLFFLMAIIMAGTIAFLKLGRAEDPSFTIKVMTVVTAWPGATAQEIQDQVAEPLEKRLQELRWYDRSETFTRPGLAFTTVTLKDTTPPADVLNEFYQARKKMSDEALKLPRGVAGPFVDDEYGDVTFALYALKAKGAPQRDLAREAEALRQRLLHVPGVNKIKIVGERPERIFVEFSQNRLATLGVSPRAIFDALGRQNLITPAGSIDAKGPQILVRLDGAFDDLAKIRDLPIVVNGATLRLSEIATVRRGYEDPAAFLVRSEGEPALLLSVVMRQGWNGLDLGKALGAEIAQVQAELPLGMTFTPVTDQAVNIKAAVNQFMKTFLEALAIVMIVSLVSLGWRVGIVVAAAVPLTLAIVLVVMWATGRVLDRITLGALILALGLLVDDAIIAIEMMVVKMEEGYDRIRASAYAWSHTAAPMLAGTLVTVIGLMPVGFAQSSAGEYAGNIFWVVGFALIASWFVAVIFTPYMGVKLLPDIKPVEGGHAAIYQTPRYQKVRRLIGWAVRRKKLVALATLGAFLIAGVGMGLVKKQFFPTSDRPELLVEVYMPKGTAIGATEKATREVETWLRRQAEAKIVTTYIGQGAPRFFMSLSSELPDPSFAKIIVRTDAEEDRNALKAKLRAAAANGLAPTARVRATQLVFGPPSPFPVAFRVNGPDLARVRGIAERVQQVMQDDPMMRTVNLDWGQRTPALRLVLDQDRLRALGLTSGDVAEQMQFFLSGVTVSQAREDIRTVDVVARSAGGDRLDPARVADFTLVGAGGQRVPVSQVGKLEVRMEDPILQRRDRVPTITVRGDIADGLQPPDVSTAMLEKLQPIIKELPSGYRIDMAGSIEEAGKANEALAPIFPIMIVLMMIVIILQVRSLSAMAIVLLTAPLGVIGVVPTLLVTGQPFGFNAILGLISLAGILMRNTLILIGQIHDNEKSGMTPYDAVVEATVQRSRPVILTALAAVLAFVPLIDSVFWGSMAVTLIGGTLGGTVLTLVFLPALYALWYRITPGDDKDAKPAAVPLASVTA
ncbi:MULTISPECIES: efflux RND transporter permease subunit [unclassified Sphingomonas]|uniref:efflux RND transporter permease subunit n=1 Tax=unclassified Sphingomonas TaxID=196159 RepID=UPI0006FF3C9C|nr:MULTISPECIES: efflux RND transporter permease subunit [unclassified Sphingomonas]KQM62653.1 multidrug transporter [Sphingomonas sp. Leaf16]KQN14904.1 multidrug transporter [Sphingomonas sp. Leaf29]KQN20437.1 multidrug transporter [Sphingomonas sp. Leaf32]